MTYYLPHDRLESWLDDLERTHRVFVPTPEGSGVVFRRRTGSAEAGDAPFVSPVCLERRPTESPRHVLFPRSEALLAFRSVNGENGPRVELFEQEAPEPRIIVGLRECDAKGFEVMDRVYMRGRYVDPLYTARRKATILAALDCVPGNGPDNACFCHWFVKDDRNRSAADILLTPVNEGFLITPVSDKGAEFMEAHAQGLERGGEERESAATALRSEAREFLEKHCPAPALSKSESAIMRQFGNSELWETIGETCLACGACTHLCPACYCFTITDETRGNAGARIRSWDTCLSAGYTLEASGHNPRAAKSQRLKNRIAHKFAYYPSLHAGESSCVGCGRCIRSCPVGVDIRTAVFRVLAADEE